MKLLYSTFLIDYLAGRPSVRAYLEAGEEIHSFVSTTINLREVASGRAMNGYRYRDGIRSIFGWDTFPPFEPEHAFDAVDIEVALRSNDRGNDGRVTSLAADIPIGAVARAIGAPVVTKDVDDFDLLDGAAVGGY